jgi:cell wall-associated NlpC family hydrolase
MKIKITIVLLLFVFTAFLSAKPEQTDSTRIKFDKIIRKAITQKADTMRIGNLIVWVALNFEGTPYVGGTLEKCEKETCVADFCGLDCVTFTENAMALARIIKKNKTQYSDFINELTYLRYRNGKITDYSSRLHYSSEWIFDGINKNIFLDKGPELNALPIKFNCHFMSKNPQYYPDVLKNSEKMQKRIAEKEEFINEQTFYYIPKDKITEIENKLQNGDIILITSNKPGLDYNHLGIIYTDSAGRKVLLHASSKMKKVIKSDEISKYILAGTANTGISIMKPIEP